jgi:YHS domain-containing protein
MRLMIPVLLAALLAGCGSIHNTVAEGADDRLMLRGNDPVSYFNAPAPLKGDPSLKSVHDGDTYRFANAANKAAFDASPGRYAPAWGGFCAAGAPYALKAAIDANVYTVYKGRLYLFGSERSKANFMMDADANIMLGDRYWEQETKNMPSRYQNAARYTFRVDHYKNDRELDQAHFLRYGKLPPGAPPLR